MKFQDVKFIKTVVRVEDFPYLQNLPEIAVVGRSNVGKSSLLNHLFKSKSLVKTSATPGKTRALNFFKVSEQCICVDMPGYGYAAVSHSESRHWADLIENYLSNRSSLKVLLFLFDIRRTPNLDDLQMLEWINHYKINSILILTKSDKVNQSTKQMQTKKIIDRLKDLPYVHYSTIKNEGRRELIALLQKMLGPDGPT